MRRLIGGLILAVVLDPMLTKSADWVRPSLNTNRPVWGIRGGLQFALPPGGFTEGEGGPRGLIRLGYPVLAEGGYDLINFIAIEPVVGGKRAYSELEKSQLDGVQGKRIWPADSSAGEGETTLNPGTLTELDGGAQQLEVAVRVEPFQNGAQVRLTLRQRSDRPDELELSVWGEPGSAPLEFCILTATMGNKARTRLLWLNDGVLSAHALFGGYEGSGFTEHAFFDLNRLLRAGEGGVIALVANDENLPQDRRPFGQRSGWDYRGRKVTQYWRVSNPSENLRLALNARYTYWQSRRPIPGGIAFENFEFQEPYRPGQTFVFGISRLLPDQVLAAAPGAENRKFLAPPARKVRQPRGRGPWDNDVIVGRVDPNRHWKQLAIFPRAGVAAVSAWPEGCLIAAHQHFPENNPEAFDKVAVRFSRDMGATWSDAEVIKLDGLPDGMRFPFDPTLVPLPDGRIRLYFTSVQRGRLGEHVPAIYSAVSENGVDYTFEPGQRFGLAGRPVIDCAVVLYRGVFHLYSPDNGAAGRPEERRGTESGRAYHASSKDGLNFLRDEDVTIPAPGHWLGCAVSDNEQITFYGTGSPGQGGGLWLATSPDGSHWILKENSLRVPVADPGVVHLSDGDLLVIGTGAPRSPRAKP